MNIDKYQTLALRTLEAESLDYPFGLLLEEAGEVIGKLNKFARKKSTNLEGAVIGAQMNDVLMHDVKKELGDVAWALVVCCHRLEVLPSEVLQMNIDKLSDRKVRGVICGSGDDR